MQEAANVLQNHRYLSSPSRPQVMIAPIYFDTSIMSDQIVAEEADILVVYDDKTGLPIVPGTHVIGHPTIGAGRALDVKGILPVESHLMLANDIATYVRDLNQFAWWVHLDPPRQRTIVSMRHQLGLVGLLAFKHMINAIEMGDWPAAEAAALDSDWARDQTPARAAREALVLRTGVYVAPPGRPLVA